MRVNDIYDSIVHFFDIEYRYLELHWILLVSTITVFYSRYEINRFSLFQLKYSWQ